MTSLWPTHAALQKEQKACTHLGGTCCATQIAPPATGEWTTEEKHRAGTANWPQAASDGQSVSAWSLGAPRCQQLNCCYLIKLRRSPSQEGRTPELGTVGATGPSPVEAVSAMGDCAHPLNSSLCCWGPKETGQLFRC